MNDPKFSFCIKTTVFSYYLKELEQVESEMVNRALDFAIMKIKVAIATHPQVTNLSAVISIRS